MRLDLKVPQAKFVSSILPFLDRTLGPERLVDWVYYRLARTISATVRKSTPVLTNSFNCVVFSFRSAIEMHEEGG